MIGLRIDAMDVAGNRGGEAYLKLITQEKLNFRGDKKEKNVDFTCNPSSYGLLFNNYPATKSNIQ